jgi:hypothetical protein
LNRLAFLLFPMICKRMHPNSVNLREDLGLIQDICMPEQTRTLAWEGSRSCWWEEPLVVALKHSEGIKHTVLLHEQKLTIN